MDLYSSVYHLDMPPVSFDLLEVATFHSSWSWKLQIFFVSEGWVNLQINGTRFSLKEKDMVLISPMEIYSVIDGKGIVALFSIDAGMVRQNCPGFELPPLKKYISFHARDSAGSLIRKKMANIISASNQNNRKTIPLDYLANGIQLLTLLIDCFALEQAETLSEADMDRTRPLIRAIDFTVVHYREHITLKQAAESAGYTPGYFSRLFSSFMGMSYMEYLTELRLCTAEQMLQEGKYNLAEIAECCGFSDRRAFSRAYRKKYGKNPVEVRGCVFLEEKTSSPSGNGEYSKSVSQELTTCINHLSSDSEQSVHLKISNVPDVSLSSPKRFFSHTWHKSISVGLAYALLDKQNQRMLRIAQEQIGYQKAIIHGILNDDMQVLYRDEAGTFAYYFGNVDIVLDFILSIHLTPVIQLGFMPSLLSEPKPARLHEGRSLVSLPKNMTLWEDLIRTLIYHFFDRYGQGTVENWIFCLWSKPDSAPLPYGFSDPDKYFHFYDRTRRTVKSCNQNIQFYSPAFLPDSVYHDHWLKRFFLLCRDSDCMPDVMRFDFYPIQFPAADYNVGRFERLKYENAENSMQRFLTDASEYCREQNIPFSKIHLEEWNFTISQREYINDTCYMAGFIVKTVLECWDKSSDFAYMSLSDVNGETLLSNELFFGGFGMFTKGGGRKPSYWAFLFLSRLGDHLVKQGDGYIVTTRGEQVQILFYNYCHYSELYANGESFNVTSDNRYVAFMDQCRNQFHLTLTDLSSSQYMVTTHILNREHGSIYDAWTDFGSLNPVSREEFEYLQGCSQPAITRRIEKVSDGRLYFTPMLEPFEVRLIELRSVRTK